MVINFRPYLKIPILREANNLILFNHCNTITTKNQQLELGGLKIYDADQSFSLNCPKAQAF